MDEVKNYPPYLDCPKPRREQTNADRIRAMSDEELATQLVQVFKEGIKVLTDMDVPEELLDKFWNSFLERLKQPVEENDNG